MSADASGQQHPGGGPLAGVRVVDCSVNVLGPIATQILGDMGADVIKVEPPTGDPMRQLGPAGHPGMGHHFLAFNRNKKSVVLDLKHGPAREALLKLAAGSDVFVHNMRTAAAGRLGIDYARLAAANPRLVYASATGYRQHGPRADRPAFDDMIQGESGLASMIGRANGEPRYVPMAMADKLCGYVLASSIAMALFHRERSGAGQELHVPMFETMVAFNLADHLWQGAFGAPEKGIGFPRMFTPGRRPYPTQDGHICVIANTDRQWRGVFEAIERPELTQDPRFGSLGTRTQHVGELLGLLADALTRRTTAEWRQRLDAADVPNSPMRSMEELYADPYLREQDFFPTRTDASGTESVTLGIPVAFYGTPGELRLPPPLLGQHTAEVLASLDYGEAEIAQIAAGTPKN